MRKLTSILALSFMLGACASRSVKVMDARWVSMKHSSAPANPASLKYVASVEERYCQESWTNGSYGLMDEVEKLAEKKYAIDYIRDASFTKDVGRSCATVSGDGYKLVP